VRAWLLLHASEVLFGADLGFFEAGHAFFGAGLGLGQADDGFFQTGVGLDQTGEGLFHSRMGHRQARQALFHRSVALGQLVDLRLQPTQASFQPPAQVRDPLVPAGRQVIQGLEEGVHGRFVKHPAEDGAQRVLLFPGERLHRDSLSEGTSLSV
jgi:hypothetical protein